MKKVLQIVIFISIATASACDCMIPSITEKYMRSDFVAKIRISKVYMNDGSEEVYKSDIEILELYKGNRINSIYVAGRSDNLMGSSCSIYIPENTELIIYAGRAKDGKYFIGACSGHLYTKNYYYINQEKIKREEAILTTFKTKNINISNKGFFDTNGSIGDELEKFKGIRLDKSFAIYEITFSSKLAVKRIREISGFGTSIDKELIKILKRVEWRSFENGLENKVPNNTKILYGIYYYGPEKDNQSFLSQHDL